MEWRGVYTETGTCPELWRLRRAGGLEADSRSTGHGRTDYNCPRPIPSVRGRKAPFSRDVGRASLDSLGKAEKRLQCGQAVLKIVELGTLSCRMGFRPGDHFVRAIGAEKFRDAFSARGLIASGVVMILALWTGIAVLAAAVLCLAFLMLGLLRKVQVLDWHYEQLHTTTPRRIGRDGVLPGKTAPDFTLPSLDGGKRSLSDFAGHRILLVFTQQGCGPCHQLLPVLPRFQSHDLQVLVVNNGQIDDTETDWKRLTPQIPVLFQEKYEISKRYEILSSPFAFIIDEAGRVVAKGVVNSSQHLQLLQDEARQWEVKSKSTAESGARRESGSQAEQPALEAETVGNQA
jgi:methylamine dehydrogenase accessory protein MauD